MPTASKIAAHSPLQHLGPALGDLCTRPTKTILPAWSWKAAILAALYHAGYFFYLNLQAGGRVALHAFLVEVFFDVFAAGLIGAISQQLRAAKPLWATAIIVWLVMPAVFTFAQFEVHHLARTPHLGTGVVMTFLLTALGSSYSWYAMAHGAILGGAAATTFRHDLRALPGITRDYLLAIPRMIFKH